ncbi:MAG TPA: pyrroloquinoline quinone-dependent dehydrogenase, partial [Bryobacteraceae bacterium]|nr:pyrroloquinoline quinone-dependent dehydrogenase [Bryobacteraceae bacterium]
MRPLLPLLLGPALLAQSSKTQSPAADWPMFNRDLAGTRYSPLTQINTSNVSKLTPTWTYKFNRPGKTIRGDSPSELYQEITPIVVGGVMYMPSGDRVVALDAETGKEIWVYEMPSGLTSFRGVSY